MARSASWCFTLNNPTAEETAGIKEWDVQYLIFGQEVGAEGTPHLQGFVQFKARKRFNQVKGLMPRAHIEVARGRVPDNVAYCSKTDKNPHIKGEPVIQGQRSDLDRTRREAAANGMCNLARSANAQQLLIARVFLEFHEECRDWVPNVTWIWGSTGTGKSRLARLICPDAYKKSNPGHWWPGYDGHENVIIDDFREDWWSLSYMLNLLDRYEFRVEPKGTHRQFKGRNIVVTTVKPPHQCWPEVNEDLNQLTRRCTRIIHLIEGEPWPEVG